MNQPISIFARFIACGLALAAACTTSPSSHAENLARYDSEIAAFEAYDRQNAFPRNPILFVGSSSIRMWPTAESFPDLPVINRGFGGSHAAEVNHYADRIVLKYAPRTIVFYAGDNDINDGKSPEQVADDFRKFVALVHARLPETRIVYLPIKPSVARWNKWPQMQATNALVEEFTDTDPRLIYVDTATPMLGSDGRPRSELLLGDGLHMNADGYKIWSKYLLPTIRELKSP